MKNVRSVIMTLSSRQRYPGIASLLLGLVGCSGRVVTSDTPGAARALSGQVMSSSSAADAESGVNPLPASLLSLPANESMMETFSSAVEAPGATHYRAAIFDGKISNCSSLGPLKKISEILTLSVGAAGDKTICLQAAHEKGVFGNTVLFNFRKRDALGDYPEVKAMGAPQWYTFGSESAISMISNDALEYRASFSSIVNPTAACKTLERFPWKNINESMTVKYAYDGPWQLCVEVRDKYGRKSQAPQSFVWIRDTIYPVPLPLQLPDAPTVESEFTLSVSGNLVDSYQHVLVEGQSTCAGISYPPVVPASTPLKVSLNKDGVWTLCLMTESKNGYKQQAPYIHTIRKVSPIVVQNPEPQNPGMNPTPTPTSNSGANPVINPVAVVAMSPVPVNASKVPLSTNRSFTISGQTVTHYKSFTMDYSSECPLTVPTSAAVEVKTPLNISFRNGGIKTLCIWGVSRTASGTETIQATATWFRFHNDTNYSMIGKSISNPVPYKFSEVRRSCSCHDTAPKNYYFSEKAWMTYAEVISNRIRTNAAGVTMPPLGWEGKDAQKASFMAYLATIPGFPMDMPFVIVNP